MNIGKVNSNITSSSATPFRSKEYENPVSRSTERNLAIWGSLGGAAATGAIVGGATKYLIPSAKEGTFIQRNKWAMLAGAVSAGVVLAFTLPAKLYNTKVNAFTKQKEMDVFSRDRALKSNLTEQVDKEVKDEDVSLDKKLDDNLKLQTANRGSALVVANTNS